MSKKIVVDFSGGLQILFKDHEISIELKDEENKSNIESLIKILKEEHIQRNSELFLVDNDKLRPGILVLINDTDWELEGKEDYILQNNDKISFISTLHGG